MKKTLSALVLAAGITLSPKPSIADTDSVKDEVIEVEDKKDNKTEIKNKKEDKKTNEYSVLYTWHYRNRWSKGPLFELSDSARKRWLTLGVYASDSYILSEKSIPANDIIAIVIGGDVKIRTKRREIYFSPQLNYTLYRKEFNPFKSKMSQGELELRVGAGMEVRVYSDTYRYIVEGIVNESIEIPIPDMSVDTNPVVSFTQIIKTGLISERYTLQVDKNGNVTHILGVGGRF